MSSLPLAGRRVLVTRAAHQAGKLSEALRAVGAVPVEVPVLEILPPDSFASLDGALSQLGYYEWLVLASTNAVRALADRAADLHISLQSEFSGQVAAIGEATVAAARKAGLHVSLIPKSYVAESLVKDLASRAARQRVLLVRAAVARDVIPDALKAVGAQVEVVEAYRNAMPGGTPDLLRNALATGLHAVTFTSSSSAMHLADAAHAAGVKFPFEGVPAISIGPVTSQTLRDLGWEPAIEASVFDISGLVAAAVRVLAADDKD